MTLDELKAELTAAKQGRDNALRQLGVMEGFVSCLEQMIGHEEAKEPDAPAEAPSEPDELDAAAAD